MTMEHARMDAAGYISQRRLPKGPGRIAEKETAIETLQLADTANYNSQTQQAA